MASDVFVFDVRPATRWVMWSNDGNLGQRHWAGENPPFGAVLQYFLKAESREPVTATIADNSGNVVRVLRNGPRTAGVNQLVWDLRYDATPATATAAGGETAEGRGAGGGRGGGGGGGRGGGAPLVVPGDYTVTMRLAGREIRKPIKVELDPRANVTTADLIAQRDLGMNLRDLGARVTAVIDRTEDLMRQLTALVENLRRNAPNERNALNEAESALVELRKLRDEKLLRPIQGLGYRQYPRLREEVNSLSGAVTRSITKPTDAQVGRHTELVSETSQVQRELQAIVDGRVARLNEMLKNLPHVIVPGRIVM
jgi:hypothetical protein